MHQQAYTHIAAYMHFFENTSGAIRRFNDASAHVSLTTPYCQHDPSTPGSRIETSYYATTSGHLGQAQEAHGDAKGS